MTVDLATHPYMSKLRHTCLLSVFAQSVQTETSEKAHSLPNFASEAPAMVQALA